MSASWTELVEQVRQGRRPPFSAHWEAFRKAHRDDPLPIAWWPDEQTRERSNLLSLMRELGLGDYPALHRFSVENKQEFWRRVLPRLGIVFAREPDSILDLADGVKHPRWLPGARLEITRSCFGAPPETAAILYGRERDEGGLESLSYAELDAQVDRFANGLLDRGFEPGQSVALYMPMTPECVVAYLGTVRAGCRVLSIADSFSAEELRRRMEIGGARAVVTVSSYRRAGRTIDLYGKVRAAVRGLEEPPIAIVLEAKELDRGDVPWEGFLVDRRDSPALAFDPDHVTNVLFSSGTTGDPKAIPWTELTPLKAGMDAHFHHDIHAGDVVCWPTNIGWMMGPWLIYASLLNDATMALYEGAPLGPGFTRFVHDAGVGMLGVVPSIVRAWRRTEDVEAGGWPHVRLFSSTGEASSPEDYLWLMSRTDYRAPVVEYLGGTEIGGGHLTGTVLQPASPSTFTTAALGVDVVILDKSGTGELFLVPPALGLSQELLNRDHDAVYYDGCPTGPRGEVLRRHGDEISRLPNGYFRAQGRADDTMNLGGIKVASLELERVVGTHAGVSECAAVAVPPEGGGPERLVLYVVLEDGGSPDGLERELGDRIARHLNPLFKIHDVVVVDALPRTASNKVMRRRLRDEYASRTAVRRSGGPAR
ncbi:MAG: AMP-binding protein [Acidobacteria bacterium]|nr:AMP-binding protein [Acidobacteriota bacterium]